ncbi:MAG: sigma factor-like helix-turn-helix DNA-binding protein [bacterium]|nr:sigma factor-like helix-turn-helix DNA-binding protein [bacterium]MDZ4231235.1 sigma factor-like helix-turn-helix DNA-binding protein [Patescibacteria group bacterium]
MFKIAVEIDIDELVKKALQVEDKRGRDIVVRRFGLKSPETQTLASLGEEYDLTRERIRQIEAATLSLIKERIEKEKQSQAFIQFIETYLKDIANFRRSDLLARDIAILAGVDDDYHPVFENKLNFLGKVLGRPYIVDETQHMHTIWHTDPEIYSLAKRLIDKLLQHKEHDFELYLQRITEEYDLPESVIVNYLSASKRFGIGPYGHMGADHWLRVNPKTVRDKAYLVLRESGEPMHFAEIARLVNEISEKKKAQATVHNELIRDPRFTLTGRGTYSLNG